MVGLSISLGLVDGRGIQAYPRHARSDKLQPRNGITMLSETGQDMTASVDVDEVFGKEAIHKSQETPNRAGFKLKPDFGLSKNIVPKPIVDRSEVKGEQGFTSPTTRIKLGNLHIHHYQSKYISFETCSF